MLQLDAGVHCHYLFTDLMSIVLLRTLLIKFIVQPIYRVLFNHMTHADCPVQVSGTYRSTLSYCEFHVFSDMELCRR